MPKRIILVALAALATLAACNSGNINNLYGSATPTVGPTASPVANPSASAAVVTVDASGAPQAGLAVSLLPASVPNPSARPAGTPIATQTTNPSGQATFGNLTATTWYCFQATYQPTPLPSSSPAPTPLQQTQTLCTDLWGNGTGITISF